MTQKGKSTTQNKIIIGMGYGLSCLICKTNKNNEYNVYEKDNVDFRACGLSYL
ncbi:13709_t:CDS:2 [Funneliformis geosporum]|uniref:16601_t:CDS:1 n=1 Tax=Funneliformis geosporum TaxID=1117311 RepID=A0A9W4SCD0_9GLOM|nr:13709_t:CDS:2 [Funneliformis geosporum]CAI2163717.1 16601_t:CDS:2 [Funneliformis geosporum]